MGSLQAQTGFHRSGVCVSCLFRSLAVSLLCCVLSALVLLEKYMCSIATVKTWIGYEAIRFSAREELLCLYAA